MTTTVATPPALLTAEEFVERYPDHRVELVNGVVKEIPLPAPIHGLVCMTAGALLYTHVKQHGLGRVMSNDSWVKTGSNPDTVHGSDVCYFSYERLPRGDMPRGLLEQVPELVIEVRSPSDRWKNVMEKIVEYLNAGVLVVVDINPEAKSVGIHRADREEHLHNGDVLSLPDLLPGFSVPVKQLFDG